MQILTLTSRYGKFNQENKYQTLSESVCKRYDKTFWCVFSVHSSNCCLLANAKFHKVG